MLVPQSEPEYGIATFRDIMIPMRDGTRLATDIHRPTADGDLAPGRFPIVLIRTSYDKSADWIVEDSFYFTPRGYVVAIQDLRGRYNSEGIGQYYHVANPTAGTDGYDTVEWLASQTWSNGRVGTTGGSHLAMVQTHMALYRPPHLCCIWPDIGPINGYHHHMRMGGAMQYHMFGALFWHAHEAQEIRDDVAGTSTILDAMERMRELVYWAPFKPGLTPLRVVPNLEKTLFDYYYRGEYDEYWSSECQDYERNFHRHADIPGTYSGGWYDPYVIATTDYYTAMSKQNKSPQRMIIGPWTHGSMRIRRSWAGEVDFGKAGMWGLERYHEERLRWFDRWLKEIPNGLEAEPPIRIFVMGGGDGHRTPEGKLSHGGVWRSENEWPLERTQYTTFFLHTDQRLSRDLPGDDDQPARFSYDPGNPVPTVSGPVTGFFELAPLGEMSSTFWARYLKPRQRVRSIVEDGPKDQREGPGIVGAKPPYLPLSARRDVLVFQTAPLPTEVEITGPISAKLWVSSSAVDTDFTAKLIDVYPPSVDYPDGFDLILTDSIIRTRYRQSWEEPELMLPGKIYEVQITLPPISNLFQAGHRIRVDISSSNFPRFDINPNTGEPMGRHTHSVVAHNTVYLDRQHPSHIVLPVIP